MDLSGRMLELARRSSRWGAGSYRQADARAAEFPRSEYDLIATHFFFDCFGAKELDLLDRANRSSREAASKMGGLGISSCIAGGAAARERSIPVFPDHHGAQDPHAGGSSADLRSHGIPPDQRKPFARWVSGFRSYGSDNRGLDLEKTLLRKVGEAVTRFKMIRDGDRVAVALSGGKDSLTMLEALILLRDRAPIEFTVCAFTVEQGKFLRPIEPMGEYLKSRGIDWTYHRDNPSMRLIDEQPDHGCDMCSRFRRRAVYEIARGLGANVIAFGHTADDLCESFLRNALFTGTYQCAAAGHVVQQEGLPAHPAAGVRNRGHHHRAIAESWEHR